MFDGTIKSSKKILTCYLCSEFYVHDWLQSCRYKIRELWGLFAEVREKSVLAWVSKLLTFIV